MAEADRDGGDAAQSAWASCLLGENLWTVLLVLLASGLMFGLSVPEVQPLIIGVMLARLVLNCWLSRRAAMSDRETPEGKANLSGPPAACARSHLLERP